MYSVLHLYQLGHVYERSVIEWENQASQGNEKQGNQKNSERKKKGVYYTPEIITDYISINTITPYLLEKIGDKHATFEDLIGQKNKSKNKEALRILESIKILDPACGSGAFLIKAAEVLFNLKRRLYYETKTGKKAYDSKFEIITENIYGVDILEGAVEISKLRLWLWLISDYEENKDEIKALPNIEYNLRVGNSLVGWAKGGLPQVPVFTPLTSAINDALVELNNFEGIDKTELSKAKMLLEKYGLENYIEAYYLLYKVYRKTHGDQAKRLKEIVESVRKSIYNSVSPVFLSNGRYSKDTTLINLVKEGKLELFHWKIDFGQILINGGFDLIIANPPYVKEYVNKAAFDGIRDSPYYQGKMDLWYFFACRAIDLLKDKGILTFIAQNIWVTSFGASSMRNKVITDTKILKLLDFNDYKVFQNVGIQTMIMFFKKDSLSDNYCFDYRRLLSQEAEIDDVIDLLNYKKNPKIEFLNPVIARAELKDKQFTFCNSTNEAILKKIDAARNFELEDTEVCAGIDVHQDRVNKSHLEKVPNLALNQGIFILSDDELKALNLNDKELSLIKPFYTTENLGKYVRKTKNNSWIIYTTTDSIKNIRSFPKIKRHLDKFKKIITSDFAPYGLHRARQEDFFKGNKIISLRKCEMPTFTYTNFDCYVSLTFYVIKSQRIDLKYLTCLLNSNLIAFWLKNKGKMQGNNFQIDKEPLMQLPIRVPENDDKNKVIELFNLIEENPIDAKIRDVERRLNQIIYDIYEIDAKEIKIIEGN
ncbi:MAG: Eco57I restriction-modification methylase domain-containing protein [Bacillota bacterium]